MVRAGIKKKQGSIVEIIKNEILSGNIMSGTEMTQNELAESLGVSRMPVREALILLEYQGLVKRLPNNHVQVTAFTEEYFSEIFRLCAVLERKALDTDKKGICVEKSFIYLEDMPEEILIHHQISRKLSNAFLQKTLDTIIDIYIDYAVRCTLYDSEKRLFLLNEALSANSAEKRKKLFEQYFKRLEEVIWKKRR